jgi:AraC-like DNA-binding protein
VTLEVGVPAHEGRLDCVTIVGVLALHASADVEPSGVVGGVVRLLDGERVSHSQDLVQGRHYTDAGLTTDVYRLNGDGTSVETVGRVEIDGALYRVDKLTLNVPGGLRADRLVVRDLGTPASFLLFDVLFEFEESAVCPFKGYDGRVALSEIGSILRLRDRARLEKAIYQMSEGIHQCGDDIDEARGLALTFLAAVVSALIEIDSRRAMHKEQLEAARELEGLFDPRSISIATVARVRRLTDAVVQRSSRTGDVLIDRALEVMARNFAGSLDADRLARELNLSTSHFRHLFREATRQPFHKYLVSMRLERARELLLQTDIPVTEIADTVGFQNSAHFSRAFSKRFGTAPSALRQFRR